MQSAEVIIVGGGPAGVSTALFLAHAAPQLTDRIVVLEKEHYPREKYCAGGVGARADRLLGAIGVVVDVPSAFVSGVAFRAMGRTTVVRDGEIGRVVRRIEFDHELARQARARGIRIVEGAKVGAIDITADGVRVDSAAGEWRGRVLVGADGVGSVVRRRIGLGATRYKAQALEVDTEHVDGDLDRDLLLFDASRRQLPGYYWDFPTIVDGRKLVCRGVYLLRTDGHDPGVEIRDILAAELEARGLSLADCRQKRFAERGFDPHEPVSRPRVLLVGEAAGIDPVTGEGIAQAIQYGSVAGRYLARKLPAGDLELSDWPREIRRTMIGRDLYTRSAGCHLFYGERRPHIEAFLHASPDFIRIGLQHFAGKRWSRGTLARAGASALWHTSRAVLFGSEGDARAASDAATAPG